MTALTLEWRKIEPLTVGFVPQPSGQAIPAAIIGPPGSSATAYEHVQTSASAGWTVNHNLARWPSAVTVVTTGGVEAEATVTHVSPAQLIIAFAAPFAGRARII